MKNKTALLLITVLIVQSFNMEILHAAAPASQPTQKRTGQVERPSQPPQTPSEASQNPIKQSDYCPGRGVIRFQSQCSFFKQKTAVNRKGVLNKKANFILVSKSKRKLVLFSSETPLKEYKINLGFSPVGHKVQEADGKTPEGQYFIEFKNPNSRFRRSLMVSYPDKNDCARAEKLDVNPGGLIMIHGEPDRATKREEVRQGIAEKGYQDWTFGCMAVTDHDAEEIYQAVDVHTAIEICP